MNLEIHARIPAKIANAVASLYGPGHPKRPYALNAVAHAIDNELTLALDNLAHFKPFEVAKLQIACSPHLNHIAA